MAPYLLPVPKEWAFGKTEILSILLFKIPAQNIYLAPVLKDLLLGCNFCFSSADITGSFGCSTASYAQGFPVGVPRPSLQAELAPLCAIM